MTKKEEIAKLKKRLSELIGDMHVGDFYKDDDGCIMQIEDIADDEVRVITFDACFREIELCYFSKEELSENIPITEEEARAFWISSFDDVFNQC